MTTPDYGTDLSCTDDASEEGRLVSGVEMVTEALIRRWNTPRGGLLDDEDYGTDLKEYINEDVDDLALSKIRGEVRAEALKEVELVADCTIASCTFIGGGRIVIVMSIRLTDGPTFPLTIAISSVTVDLLEAA